MNLYHKAIVVAAVAIFYTNIPAYTYRVMGDPLEPWHWMLLFTTLALPVLVTQKTIWEVVKSPVMLWCFLFAGLTVAGFMVSSQSDKPWQEVRNRILTIIEIIVFLGVLWEAEATKIARQALVPGVMVGVFFNVYELFVPMSFSPIPGRSAGLYELSTLAGEALVLGMILGVGALPSQYRSPFVFLTGIGIFTTFSRGGIVAWMISVAAFLFIGKITAKHFLQTLFGCLMIVFLVLVPQLDELLSTWERNGALNANVEERLAWFTDPSGVSDYSSWERKYLAQKAWERIAERPVFGSGTGSVYESYMPPHNQYLSHMLDHGLVGGLLMPLLAFALLWRARRADKRLILIFGGVLMMLSLFSHTLLNTTYTLLLITLAAAIASQSSHQVSSNRVKVGGMAPAFANA